MVAKSATRTGKAIIRKKLKRRSVGEISEILDVDPTHVYNVDRRGVSPTLHDALVDVGWVEAPKKRHRVALEVETAAEAAALRAILARHGSRRRVARALVKGELKIVESD